MLDAERTLLTAQDQVAQSKGQLGSNLISLYSPGRRLDACCGNAAIETQYPWVRRTRGLPLPGAARIDQKIADNGLRVKVDGAASRFNLDRT
jgi:hypothetical protein